MSCSASAKSQFQAECEKHDDRQAQITFSSGNLKSHSLAFIECLLCPHNNNNNNNNNHL